MGVVNLYLHNKALLLGWLWRLYAEGQKIWATYAKMIHAHRPTPDGPLILSASGSFFWRALLKLKQIFYSSTNFHIHSGKQVSFWFDKWSAQPMVGQVARALAGALPNRNISLFLAKQRSHQLFPRPLSLICHQIVQCLTLFTPTQGTDVLTWNLTNSGQFSVKSIYKVLSQGGKIRSATTAIWKAHVTPSMKIFFFLFLRNRLLTHELLQKRNIAYQPGCVMCDCAVHEDSKHLFFHCNYATQMWQVLSTTLDYDIVSVQESNTHTYLNSIPNDKDRRNKWTTTFITALWLLWRERNQRTFRNTRVPVAVLIDRILHDADSYLKHC